MSSISSEIKAWSAEQVEELPLHVLCYRVMTMVAYLGDNGKEVHEANDLGTAYAIGYSLQHLPKLGDTAIQYILGAYNALAEYYRENEISPIQTAEENNGSTDELYIQD